MRSLCLNVELEGNANTHSDLTASAETQEMEEELLGAPLDTASSPEGEELLGSITAELDDLLDFSGDQEEASAEATETIAEGEEN